MILISFQAKKKIFHNVQSYKTPFQIYNSEICVYLYYTIYFITYQEINKKKRPKRCWNISRSAGECGTFTILSM
nr:MAG TPA: hypothetical protein [Caudoviricetes sp.]